jgi:hypothetical protein
MLARGPKLGQGGSVASTVQLGKKFTKQKLTCINGLVSIKIFGPNIWIWKDLGPMYFWSCDPSFSDKVYKTKVVVHLPNSQLFQGLTS